MNDYCIQVISPARSLGLGFVTDELIKKANCNLNKVGCKVKFSENANKIQFLNSPSVEERVSDLHNAFKDPNIDAIICGLGGFNSNQILPYLDFDLIRKNPKPICGYSDITTLANALHHKTGLITYLGPLYTSFSSAQDYTLNSFKKVLINKEPIDIQDSETWSNPKWMNYYKDTSEHENTGSYILNEGSGEAKVLGGNLITFVQLMGSEYMPDIRNTILVIEDDDEITPAIFDSALIALSLHPNFSEIKGLLFGRFMHGSKMTKEMLSSIVKNNTQIPNVAIIANLDFGHTEPMITIPIGGTAKINATKKDGIQISFSH